MTLLNRVVEQVGPLFTTDESKAAVAALNLPPERVRALLSQLAQSGWIERLKRGLYEGTTPIFGTTLHPYAVAAALISHLAISHWSALAHHGFTTEIPPMVQASTTSTVGTPEMRQGRSIVLDDMVVVHNMTVGIQPKTRARAASKSSGHGEIHHREAYPFIQVYRQLLLSRGQGQ
jgi:predicted transcriptional regulator of viral defense system